MDVGAALVAHRQTAEALEPGEGAFDHPALATQSRLPFAALGDGVRRWCRRQKRRLLWLS